MNQAAVCEIPLQSGRLCGVTAVGRCTTCERAFCRTHQALEWYSYGSVPYVDMCAPCLAKTPVKVALAEQAKRQAEVDAASKFLWSGAARTALVASGVQPVEIYWVERRWEWKRKGILLREVLEQVVKVATPIGRGWILGTFEWEYEEAPLPKNSSGRKVKGDWLTALLGRDTLPASLPSYFRSEPRKFWRGDTNSLLARVQPYSEGYEMLGSAQYERFGRGPTLYGVEDDWIAAAQAVKRLTGESS